MERRTIAMAGAVILAAAIGLVMVYHPAFYLPFFFLFIPLGLFGRRGTDSCRSEEEGPFCPECGNTVGPDDGFCQTCGAILKKRGENPSMFDAPPRSSAGDGALRDQFFLDAELLYTARTALYSM